MNAINGTTTPVGRIVQGDAFVPNDKDFDGNIRVNKTTGVPQPQYFMALAIPKTDPEWPAIWAYISGVAQRDFPMGDYNSADFKWKYQDGDTTPDKEGFAGCHILKFASNFAPQVFNAQNQQIVDHTQCKRGFFAQIHFDAKGNGRTGSTAGVFLNLKMIKVVAFGDEISSGPSADQAFGAGPAALPQGASTVPVAPANGMPAATAPAPVAPAPVAVAPAPVAPAPVAPAPGVVPAHEFLNGPQPQ